MTMRNTIHSALTRERLFVLMHCSYLAITVKNKVSICQYLHQNGKSAPIHNVRDEVPPHMAFLLLLIPTYGALN